MISLNNFKQDLFLLSLFLYPLVFLNHILYLIPQFSLLIIMLLERKHDKNLFLILMFLFLSCFIAFFVEINSTIMLYDMISKMFINLISIVVVAYNCMIINERSRKIIIYMVFLWLVMVLYAYKSSGFDNLSSLYSLLRMGDLNSSDLYNAAEPISLFFLTKNITAMFIVAIFSFFIYLSDTLKKRVSSAEFLLFFVTILSFLSRQAILAYFVILSIYMFRYGGKYTKFIFITLSFSTALWFFSNFINLNNSNDGASERLYLWKYFFSTVDQYFFLGLGFNGLNQFVQKISEVGNFHMFFMNQIGLYGFFHFIFFNLFLYLIYKSNKNSSRIYLLVAYFLNVLFQTYGYEYGNLFLFMILMMVVKPSRKISTI